MQFQEEMKNADRQAEKPLLFNCFRVFPFRCAGN